MFLRTEISVFAGVADIRSVVKLAAMKWLKILAYSVAIVFATRFARIKAGGISADLTLQTPGEICAFGL